MNNAITFVRMTNTLLVLAMCECMLQDMYGVRAAPDGTHAMDN